MIFETGGSVTIPKLEIKKPYLTLAGQTAPGDGILIKGNRVVVKNHEVIVRGMRFRPGRGAGAGVDGFGIVAGADGVNNVILDHISVSWSTDEVMGIFGTLGDVTNVTVQNSLIGEGLLTHNFGLLISRKHKQPKGPGRVTVYRNLLTNCSERMPAVSSSVKEAEVINNLSYNWADKAGQNRAGTYAN